VALLIVLLLLAGTTGLYLWATGASGPQQPVSLVIPEGATASDVGEILEDEGVIRSSLAFRVVASVRGVGASIQAGDYELTTNMTVSAVLDALEAGPLEPPSLTLATPEGLRIDEVAHEVGEQLHLSAGAFERLARSGEYALEPYLPEGTPSVEGFLFPKTYEFPQEVEVDTVATTMLGQFEEEVADLPWDRAEGLGVSPYEAVIIASMIEREAGVPEDRRKISAVIYNRLELGMLLQIDATVLYTLPEHEEPTQETLQIDTPYNTYLYPGLTPTPIANPGLASIEAALRPADVDYLYYVLIDCSGRHAFATTLEEHNRLRARSPDCG
jgi:UPF0755 protein